MKPGGLLANSYKKYLTLSTNQSKINCNWDYVEKMWMEIGQYYPAHNPVQNNQGKYERITHKDYLELRDINRGREEKLIAEYCEPTWEIFVKDETYLSKCGTELFIIYFHVNAVSWLGYKNNFLNKNKNNFFIFIHQ